MKNFKLISVVALFAAIAFQINAQDWKNISIKKVRVTRDVILFKTGESAACPNMIAVNTSKGIVVFDASQYPGVAGRVRKMIKKEFGDKFAYLVNTHAASDHTGGNEAFHDVPIIGQSNVKTEIQRDLEMAKSAEYQQAMEKMIAMSEQLWTNYPGNPLEIDESIASTRNMIASIKNNTFNPVVPDTLFNDQYSLSMGNRTIHMYHNAPSYSESDIVIYIPEEKTLIVGDIFNKKRLPWINKSFNLDLLEKTFSPYLSGKSEVRYVIGTHGDVMTMEDVKAQFKYLSKLSQEVLKIKKSGKTIDEARKELMLDNFPYLNTFNPYFYGTPIDVHNRNIQVIWMQQT